jgi:hypothetical protein
MISTQLTLVQPNVFQLRGYNTQISYATTSFASIPEFTYVNEQETLSFRGSEIQVEQTQLGEMVTVNLSRDRDSAGNIKTLTLLIPQVHLPADSPESPMQTIAVFSLRSQTEKLPGQSQNYMTICLSGTASQIEF